MANKITMKLEKAAAKSGGDKYSGEINGEAFSFYAPQSLSRPDGKPADEIDITIEVKKKK